MTRNDFTEHVAEVGGDGEIAALVALVDREPGPASIHAAAVHRTADEHHRVPVPVIGPAIAVLLHRPSKLRHRHDDDVFHAIAEIGDEGGEGACEVVEAGGELSFGGTLVHVRIPAAELGERHFETDIRL